ncbi:hypothetical protein RvVAR031_02230 [Agrobacterium vitis]|nr:hypothetical protein RvVAR031_02230 [Agrobacterium vitis]
MVDMVETLEGYPMAGLLNMRRADMQRHEIRQSPQGHRRESDGAKREPKEKTVRPNPVADDGHTFLALLQERYG